MPDDKPFFAVDCMRCLVRPYLAAILISGLALVQVRAMGRQYQAGYRPFRHEPQRVAFSWDMFAQRITRCDIEWNPPLVSKSPSNESFSRMSSLSPMFEWSPVMHDADDYLTFGRRACAKYGSGPQRSFTLTCYYPGFRETQNVIACR